MKFAKYLVVLGFVHLLASESQAGILLDPYLGYGLGASSLKYGASAAGGLASTTSEFDNSGATIGARVGYTLPLIWFSLDYAMLSGGKSKAKAAGGTDYDLSASTLSALIGLKIPFFRAWLGYSLMNSSVIKTSAGVESTLDGPQMKLGFSYTGLPLIALNFEYKSNEFKKYKTGSTEYTIPEATFLDSAKATEYMLSVSVPFDL